MLSNGLNDEEKYVRRGKNKKHEKFWLGNLMKEEQSLELCVDLRNVKKGICLRAIRMLSMLYLKVISWPL
jgi:hypothetical protein